MDKAFLKRRIKVFCIGAAIGFLASWIYLLSGGETWLFVPRWAEWVFYPGFWVGHRCYNLFENQGFATLVGTITVGISYGILFVFLHALVTVIRRWRASA